MKHDPLAAIAEIEAQRAPVDKEGMRRTWEKILVTMDKQAKPEHMKHTDDFSSDDFGKASFRWGLAIGAIVGIVICLAAALLLIEIHIIQITR